MAGVTKNVRFRKRWEIRPRLLLITNRKWHRPTPFQMKWKSPILDDFGVQSYILWTAGFLVNFLLDRPFTDFRNYFIGTVLSKIKGLSENHFGIGLSRLFSINVQSVRERLNPQATSAPPGHVTAAQGSATPESDCTLTNSRTVNDIDNRSVGLDGAVHRIKLFFRTQYCCWWLKGVSKSNSSSFVFA